MSLLITYIVLVVLGQAVTIAIGLTIDRLYSPAISLPISIALYFAMFWIAWMIAVRVTAPRSTAEPTPPTSG